MYTKKRSLVMQLTSVREFRSHLSNYTKKGDLVGVTSHGKMVGFYLPLESTEGIPLELKKEFIGNLGKHIAKKISSKGATEKDIINDFKKFKRSRSR